MQNLLNELTKALKEDDRLVIDGKLAKNKIIELSLALDKSLLGLLLRNKAIQKHFFKDINGTLVFDKIEFQKFVSNKQFLPDSYTAFKNKIGLTANGEYLTESKEVVLAWPYKDCVLEGGQTKEDQKRQEIFWNETLAPDEIDNLLKPKVFTNWRKYDRKDSHPVTNIDNNGNLLIKGNNLLALSSIQNLYSNKVKLIYIDPPYNTGNDEFLYNDTFNHSTWLTFIKNRLQLAYKLLSDDGSIFISIDENEIGFIQIILDEIFKRENRCNIISVKRGSVTGHKAINPGVVNVTEYVISYAKNKKLWKPNRLYKARDRNDRYNNFIKNRSMPSDRWEFCSLLDAFSENLNISKNMVKKKLGVEFEKEIFSFIKENADAVIQFAYPDETKVSKEAKELINKSKKKPDVVFIQSRKNESDFVLKNGQRLLFYKDRLMEIDGDLVTVEPLSDIWDDVLPNDLHNEGGVKLKKGKKPEKLISRIIDLASNENDLVLDFHIGSGTTAAACLKSNRRFIGIEQLDYSENDSKNRLVNTINGEKSGISKSVNWNGGGSFIYCELKKANAEYSDKIEKAKTTKDLLDVWQTIQKSGFISYKIDPKKINENISDFKDLSIKEQKQFLIEVLDKNQLYVNYSEIDDKDYNISKEDKILNHQFYGKK
ncbi:MAG: DNA methyltransferase [bacterium]